MNQINKMIDDCLNSDDLTGAQIDFIHSIDEKDLMPSPKEIEVLKRIWHTVNEFKEVA